MIWFKFAWFQVRSLAATIVGWFLLAPLAAFKQWRWQLAYPSLKHDQIAVWRWSWVDGIWGNAEDGVTGDNFYAARFKSQRLCAYLWSAWRNSANNMRWSNSVVGGPFVRITKGRWIFQFGYRPDNGWPVLRLVRV